MMSGTKKQFELGPDFVGYHKQLLAELYSETEDGNLSFLGSDVELSHKYSEGKTKDISSSRFPSFFENKIGEDLSDFKKERLKAILHQSAVCLNHEADEIFGEVLATLKITTGLKEKELLSSQSNSGQVMNDPLSVKKRKMHSAKSDLGGLSSFLNSPSGKKVLNHIQAIQGSKEISEEAVQKYSSGISKKLLKMGEDVDEYLDAVVSKCRPMTEGEMQKLGGQIQKLPGKALGRVVEIIRLKDSSASDLPDEIAVNLEKLDNTKLWRLYYFVQTVTKAES